MSYVDASALTLSDMGSMGGKGGFGGMPDRESGKGNFGNRGSSDGTTSSNPNANKNTSSGVNAQGTSASVPEGMPQNDGMPTMPEGFEPSQMQGGFGGQMPNIGELPEGFDPSPIPGGFGGMFHGESSNGTENTPTDNSDNNDSTGTGNRPSRDNMQMPGGNWSPNMNGMGNAASSNTNLIWIAVSVLVLGVGLLIAKLYKKY